MTDPHPSRALGSDPADWTATELNRAYREASLSPVEALEAVLARIARDDGPLGAYCLVDETGARDAAAAAQRRRAAGAALGPLDGVPTSIKDVFLTTDLPTRRGSQTIDPGGSWREDAPAVARLRTAGAALVGKTTTPELAWKAVTDSPLTGLTRNPWDTAMTSGGSSGGAAVAVAAGMGPLALGTDGGGSVRIPGAFCGVVGFKPTYGTVPMYPPSPFGTLAHVGPIARTVEDAALLLDVICGFDARDWSALPAPRTGFAAGLARAEIGAGPLGGLRIAYSPDLGFARVDEQVGRAVDAAVAVLAEHGAHIDRQDPGFADPVEHFECLWFAGAAKSVGGLDARHRSRLEPALAAVCDRGLGYSAQDYLEAMAVRMDMGVRMGAFHRRYDLLVTPAVSIAPFPAGREVPPAWPTERWTGWAQMSYPFNMTQQPAISVPCGFTSDGLPVGLQVIGPRHGDHTVLAAAAAYQNATGWWRARPPVPAAV